MACRVCLKFLGPKLQGFFSFLVKHSNEYVGERLVSNPATGYLPQLIESKNGSLCCWSWCFPPGPGCFERFGPNPLLVSAFSPVLPVFQRNVGLLQLSVSLCRGLSIRARQAVSWSEGSNFRAFPLDFLSLWSMVFPSTLTWFSSRQLCVLWLKPDLGAACCLLSKYITPCGLGGSAFSWWLWRRATGRLRMPCWRRTAKSCWLRPWSERSLWIGCWHEAGKIKKSWVTSTMHWKRSMRNFRRRTRNYGTSLRSWRRARQDLILPNNM